MQPLVCMDMFIKVLFMINITDVSNDLYLLTHWCVNIMGDIYKYIFKRYFFNEIDHRLVPPGNKP